MGWSRRTCIAHKTQRSGPCDRRQCGSHHNASGRKRRLSTTASFISALAWRCCSSITNAPSSRPEGVERGRRWSRGRGMSTWSRRTVPGRRSSPRRGRPGRSTLQSNWVTNRMVLPSFSQMRSSSSCRLRRVSASRRKRFVHQHDRRIQRHTQWQSPPRWRMPPERSFG